MTAGQEPAFGEKIYLKTKRRNAPNLQGIPKKENTTISKIEKEDKVTPQPTDEVKSNQPSKSSKYPIHTVRKGDTLYAISRKYKVSVEAIKEWNNLKSNTLEVGQELIIKK